jgi:hypothetical protein
LPRYVDLPGKSGDTYRYTCLEDGRAPHSASANYVIAVVGDRSMRLIQVGETENLAKGVWRPALDEARRTHRAVQLLFRLNVSRAIREAEMRDILARHGPPADQEGPPDIDGQYAASA